MKKLRFLTPDIIGGALKMSKTSKDKIIMEPTSKDTALFWLDIYISELDQDVDEYVFDFAYENPLNLTPENFTKEYTRKKRLLQLAHKCRKVEAVKLDSTNIDTMDWEYLYQYGKLCSRDHEDFPEQLKQFDKDEVDRYCGGEPLLKLPEGYFKF